MSIEDLKKMCTGLDDAAIAEKVQAIMAPLSLTDKLAFAVELAENLEHQLIKWGKQMEAQHQ